jgi:hypothetical protein
VSGIDVAQVLEAEVVAGLAGREEGVAGEVAGEERQTVEGDGVQLGPVGGGLLEE